VPYVVALITTHLIPTSRLDTNGLLFVVETSTGEPLGKLVLVPDR
jgi:hypothetical protein